MDSAEELKRLLAELGIPPGSDAALRLMAYLALLKKWNSRTNLTSSTEWRVVGPMFREGIWASTFYPPDSIAHLDIGSGAGFPAMLLKVMVPRIRLDLVESREKKSQYLETAAHTLGLDGVSVHAMTLSDYLRACETDRRWDCISWKALKLRASDLRQLHAHGHGKTELWMFHGRQPALEDGDSMEPVFRIMRNNKVPGMREWRLSIYRQA